MSSFNSVVCILGLITCTAKVISASAGTPPLVQRYAVTTPSLAHPARSQFVPTTVAPALHKRTVITMSDSDCTAVCWDLMPGTECDVQCKQGFLEPAPATPTPSTPPTTATAALRAKAIVPRAIVAVTNAGCTAICWDLLPGTECDVKCTDSFTGTPTPTQKALLARQSSTISIPFTFSGCTGICQDDFPNVYCTGNCGTTSIFTTQFPASDVYTGSMGAGSAQTVQAACQAGTTATPAGYLGARRALQARESRFARKFGLAGRDDSPTVTVTTTVVPCATDPAVAISEASVALSQASVALAEAANTTGGGIVLPVGASAAISEASQFLVSISQHPITGPPIFANATNAGYATGTSPSAAVAASSGARLSPTKPFAATATPTSTESASEQTAGIPVATGAAVEGKIIHGFLVFVLIGLLGNVAFMV